MTSPDPRTARRALVVLNAARPFVWPEPDPILKPKPKPKPKPGR